MTCIIIDDDAMARRSLEIFCARIPILKVATICANAAEAVAAIDLHQPDLLFLDVEMPKQTGLEMLDTLTVLPQVIMTTSKTEYAFAAFNYQVTDYLKKPIAFPRFKAAVEKALALYNCLNTPFPTAVSPLQESKSPSTDPQEGVDSALSNTMNADTNTFFFRTEGRYVRLFADDILYFEYIGDYVKVCTKTSNITIYSTMKALDEKLQHPNFVKVHRSYIVNITKIVDIEENSLVIERKVIPISRAHKAGLMAKLTVI
jgi:DNA-binding LytR/AlgR family response regulator